VSGTGVHGSGIAICDAAARVKQTPRKKRIRLDAAPKKSIGRFGQEHDCRHSGQDRPGELGPGGQEVPQSGKGGAGAAGKRIGCVRKRHVDHLPHQPFHGGDLRLAQHRPFHASCGRRNHDPIAPEMN